MNDNIYELVSVSLNIPKEIIERTYRIYWKFIRETIESLPLREDLTEEDFNRLRTNFNIPSIGKLSCTFNRLLLVKNRYKHIRNLRNGTKDT